MSKSLRAQPFVDSILGIGIKILGGSRLVSISHSMSAPVSASTTHKKISTSSSKKWVPSQACNICLIDCLMLFSTSRMTENQKLMDNFHFAFGIGRPKNIQHNPPVNPSVDMENICSTNLMWEVKSIFLEYQVYVNNLVYPGATDDRCANFPASTCPFQSLKLKASSERVQDTTHNRILMFPSPIFRSGVLRQGFDKFYSVSFQARLSSFISCQNLSLA